ncbi:quinoprotein dehydrogenase-associated SoxYZ-like carrier [Algicella marina]|uniref:Quinoprotein dehydrogenase-associated SoxYZ-like carrier n=1 Tax=Algicella marina TaxID=2683284 RepID=A0A6P1T4T3_9RHOB|nr:quinoprotein dehydrogenase-associated SoxYZ-like carrier [Algicella marina]QHQ36496.1 quinoprotein dehydrogenase-associated SoxYZ-like carrier [Algicella marina]
MKTLALIALLAASPAFAAGPEPSWPMLEKELYGDQFLVPAGDLITLDVPYRTDDDARTRIAANVAAPAGRMLESVTVVLDENPMPVSAVFEFDRPVPRFFFDVTMRVNGPTPVHVVARTVEGQLLIAEGYVKTSGQGACSAPPGTDPKEALANLGEMTITVSELIRARELGEKLTGVTVAEDRRLDLDIKHPSHSGMQMNQISLLFIPMRYVETVEIDLDGAGYVDVTGSISVSENPQISLSVPRETETVGVTMTDTDGTVARIEKVLPGF